MRWFSALLLLPATAHAQAVDHIVIDKSDRTLVLLSGGKAVGTYRNIKLGDAPVGHKQFEGDEKTPEGIYKINGRNGSSAYHLSLRISYPNTADRAYAARFGRSAGSDMFIHGQPNRSPITRIPYDWTDGCIALTNAEMKVLWRQVAVGTKVTIQR